MIVNLLISCGGGNKEILNDCPTERTKFVGIGATILLTAALASISGGYALYFTFGNLWVSVIFGLLWGTVIFNLDRYIVTSMRKSEKRIDEFMMASPRFLMAIVLAFTISKPLEVKLFQGTIISKLGENEQAYIKEAVTDFNNRRDELDIKKSDLQTELETKRNSTYQNDPIYQDFQDRASQKDLDIKSWTKQIGINGPIIAKNSWLENVLIDSEKGITKKIRKYNETGLAKIRENKELNSNIQLAKTEIQVSMDSMESRKSELGDQVKQIEKQYGDQITGVQDQIKELNKKRPEMFNKVEMAAAADKDILSRLRALSQIKSFGNSVWWASLFITALFILLESAPIIVKLLSKRGPYDEILDRIEYEIRLEQQKIISDKNDEINNLLQDAADVNKLKKEVRDKLETMRSKKEFEVNESILNHIVSKQAELGKIFVNKWYEEQLEKMK